MVEENAVCDAISMACAALLKDLGVDCYVLGGDAHAWNMVSLDDELYELDCTWDMAKLSDDGTTDHQYFNKTTEYMASTEHNRDLLSLLLPEAKGDVYTYEKVTIPESVALIGKEAFAGCKKLKTVIIKDASYLQYIEEGAFQNTPKNIVFKISGSKEDFENVKAALKEAGVRKGVFKHVKA